MKLTFAVWIAYALISIGLSYFLGKDVTQQCLCPWRSLAAAGAWLTTAVFLLVIVFITTRVFRIGI